MSRLSLLASQKDRTRDTLNLLFGECYWCSNCIVAVLAFTALVGALPGKKSRSSYEELIEQEAEYWGIQAESAIKQGYSPDLEKPFRRAIIESIWDDSELNMMVRGKYISRILEYCSDKPQHLDCLELCCGMGVLSLEASRRGARVTGIDVSQRSIEIACRYARDLGIPSETLQYRVCDLNSISLPVGKFDVVLAWDGLHHIAEIEHLVGEVGRSLKHGGVFVVHDHVKGKAVLENAFRAMITAALSLIIPREPGVWTRFKEIGGGFVRKARSTSINNLQCLDSPFEDISGESIVRSIVSNFNVLEFERYLSLPESLYARVGRDPEVRTRTVGLLLTLDRLLSNLHILRPEYFFIVAEKKVASNDRVYL